MITMILLVQHLAEATSEDGARPKVTAGRYHTDRIPLQTGIPTQQVKDQEGRNHSLIHLAIRSKPRERKLLRSA